METVFDHNITQKEREAIGVSQTSKEVYLINMDEETANNHLAFLYSNRGDLKKAEFYADRLPFLMRMDCLRTISHS